MAAIVIVIGTDHISYTGRLAALRPITDLIDRFVDTEPEPCADTVALLARLMLDCAPKEEAHFTLLRDQDAIYAMLTHTDSPDPGAYHARLTAEHGPILDEYTNDWGTEPGHPDGDTPYTYAAIPRQNR